MAAEDLIETYLSHLRERSCTKRTIQTYEYHLAQSDRGMPYGLDCATEEEIRAWLWREGYGEASRALMHAAHVGFFRWAVKHGHLDFDPTTEIPRPKVPEGLPRVAPDDQARLILTEAKQPYRLWAQLAAYAGLRCIEIWRLEREHVSEQSIRVHGKGNKYRSLPTHPLIWAAVKGLPPGPLTDMPDEQAVSNRFGRYCEEHYHFRLTLHRLRGWFATAGYRATRDVRAVQRSMGHVNLANTMRYIEWAEDDRQAVVNGLPTFGVDAESSPTGEPSAPPSPPPGEAPDPPADGHGGPPPPPGPHLGE